MTDKLKVSVIVAVYNRSATITRCISSIKSQTYSNIQIVVVDGASQDDTISLVTPMLTDKDILRSEPDQGIYDALNKGLVLANGDIISFLHSDDLYFDNNVISNVVDIFSDDSINVVYGDVSFFSGNNIMKIKRTYRSAKLSKRNLAWGKMPAHPAMFIKSCIYEDIGNFETNFKIAADYDFLCRLVKHTELNCVYIPNVLVRMQLGGVSTQVLKNFIMINKEIFRAIRQNGIYTNLFMLFSRYISKILQLLMK
ncbi:glycosyltransferase [Alphaproteobacteria bacterium]|nr:glycosyltransferase [Alphaproteobacteria bacterium]